MESTLGEWLHLEQYLWGVLLGSASFFAVEFCVRAAHAACL